MFTLCICIHMQICVNIYIYFLLNDFYTLAYLFGISKRQFHQIGMWLLATFRISFLPFHFQHVHIPFCQSMPCLVLFICWLIIQTSNRMTMKHWCSSESKQFCHFISGGQGAVTGRKKQYLSIHVNQCRRHTKVFNILLQQRQS